MTALDAAQRAEHAQLVNALLGAADALRTVTNGIAVRVPVQHLVDAARWISLERACCPFFNFVLDVTAGSDTLELHITGPAGAEAFIAAELGHALPTRLAALLPR